MIILSIWIILSRKTERGFSFQVRMMTAAKLDSNIEPFALIISLTIPLSRDLVVSGL